MYPNESCLSPSVLCTSHNMIGWYIHIYLLKYESCVWLYDELFSTLAYPLFVVCSVVWFFSSCDDHQFIDVSICEKYSWSTWRWWFRFLVIWTWALLIMSSFRAMAHVLSGLWILFLEYCRYVIILYYWHRGMPSFSSIFFWKLYGVRIIHPDRAIILLYVTPFNLGY